MASKDSSKSPSPSPSPSHQTQNHVDVIKVSILWLNCKLVHKHDRYNPFPDRIIILIIINNCSFWNFCSNSEIVFSTNNHEKWSDINILPLILNIILLGVAELWMRFIIGILEWNFSLAFWIENVSDGCVHFVSSIERNDLSLFFFLFFF